MSKIQDMLQTHYDAVNSGDLDAAVAVFDADVETQTPHGPMKGIDEVR
jgi:ketosteroid isomerase-like protein